MSLDNTHSLELYMYAERYVNNLFKEALGKDYSKRDLLLDPKAKSDWDFMFGYVSKALTHTDNLEYYIPNAKLSPIIREYNAGLTVKISKAYRDKFLNLLAYYQGLNLL